MEGNVVEFPRWSMVRFRALAVGIALACVATGCSTNGPPEQSSAFARSETIVDAFAALCLAGDVNRTGHEAETERAARLVTISGDEEIIVRAHDFWPGGIMINWRDESFELDSVDEARLCGLVNLQGISLAELNTALTRRVGTISSERHSQLMPGVTALTREGPIESAVLPHTVWTISLHGKTYEIVTVQTGHGPQPAIQYFNGVQSHVLLDDRRLTIWLRRPPTRELAH